MAVLPWYPATLSSLHICLGKMLVYLHHLFGSCSTMGETEFCLLIWDKQIMHSLFFLLCQHDFRHNILINVSLFALTAIKIFTSINFSSKRVGSDRFINNSKKEVHLSDFYRAAVVSTLWLWLGWRVFEKTHSKTWIFSLFVFGFKLIHKF